jgi:hypothetical protein
MTQRPITRVDDTLIFPDGSSRPLTANELLRLGNMAAGERLTVNPTSGHRTRLVGEVCGGCVKRGKCLVPGAPRCANTH